VINGEPVELKHDGSALTGEDDGPQLRNALHRDIAGRRTHPILKLSATVRSTTRRKSSCRRRSVRHGDNRDNSADSRIPVANGGVGLLPCRT